MQILLAGKAHPADKAGQELIQHIFQLSQSDDLKGRVFFVEDYDMRVGRMLVQGVDVWLNTPAPPARGLWDIGHEGGDERRAQSARSPTAGGPRASTARTAGSSPASRPRQATRLRTTWRRTARTGWRSTTCSKSRSCRRYYDRDDQGLPGDWIRTMKEAIATITPRFSSDRMVRDYCESAYVSLLQRRDGETRA